MACKCDTEWAHNGTLVLCCVRVRSGADLQSGLVYTVALGYQEYSVKLDACMVDLTILHIYCDATPAIYLIGMTRL